MPKERQRSKNEKNPRPSASDLGVQQGVRCKERQHSEDSSRMTNDMRGMEEPCEPPRRNTWTVGLDTQGCLKATRRATYRQGSY